MAQGAPSYGGQAVLEGVVMRGPRYVSLSVRRPDGDVASMTKKALSPSQKSAFMRLPIVRGAFAFWDSLSLGVEMLIKSAEIAEPQEAAPAKAAVTAGVAVGAALAIGLFIVLPAVLTAWVMPLLHWGGRLVTSLVETVLRMTILVSYIALVFRMQEIQRVLQYHGAEHKTIWAWEKNYRDIIEKVRMERWDASQVTRFLSERAVKESRLHPRCGTSFLFIVVLCTWIVFLFVTPPNLLARIALRLALLPVAAGLSYEALKASADRDNAFWRVIRAPGMALQSMTTKEPDVSELEIAADSLVHLLEVEGGVFR